MPCKTCKKYDTSRIPQTFNRLNKNISKLQCVSSILKLCNITTLFKIAINYYTKDLNILKKKLFRTIECEARALHKSWKIRNNNNKTHRYVKCIVDLKKCGNVSGRFCPKTFHISNVLIMTTTRMLVHFPLIRRFYVLANVLIITHDVLSDRKNLDFSKPRQLGRRNVRGDERMLIKVKWEKTKDRDVFINALNSKNT